MDQFRAVWASHRLLLPVGLIYCKDKFQNQWQMEPFRIVDGFLIQVLDAVANIKRIQELNRFQLNFESDFPRIILTDLTTNLRTIGKMQPRTIIPNKKAITDRLARLP